MIITLIFISYATEDITYAQKLYISLKNQGLSPWMDNPPEPFQYDGLMIGELWRVVLIDKIEHAEHIILVLSPRSIKKRGFVQREFRLALERMSYLTDKRVLVLPIVVEDCEIPELSAGDLSLTDLHWQQVPEDSIENFTSHLADRFGE